MLGKLLPLLLLPLTFGGFSASSNYQLKSYGVNSGGTNSTSSSTFSAQAGTGEIGGNSSNGPTYTTKSGSIEAQQANVPGAPTLSNGSGTFTNKLNFIINTSSNPSDTTYVIAVSTSPTFASNAPFVGTIYVAGNSTGLVSSAAANYNMHVTAPSVNLTSLSECFGLQGLTASSPLAIQTPYDGTSNTVGAVSYTH